MTVFDGVQELANKLSAEIKGNLARYQNQSFRDACMAACALVAMADGVLQDDERRKVIACIQNTDALGHFSATDLRDIFVRFCDLAKDVSRLIGFFIFWRSYAICAAAKVPC